MNNSNFTGPDGILMGIEFYLEAQIQVVEEM